MSIDGEELVRARRRQMVYLDHYGSTPMHAWENRSVLALEDAYAEMNRIIGRENGETVSDD
jgi:hypothetical protein